MKRIFSIVAALCFLSAQSLDAQRLTILHTNDTHSHIDPQRGGRDDGKLGVIERAAFIDSVRTADGRRNVLLLDAGDFDQGSSYFIVLGGRVEVDLLNAMGYDAVALGNHEFDNGIEDLCERMKRFKGDVLCANYDFSEFELGKYVKPYAIYRRGGLKIGVIGLLTNVRSVVAAETAARLKYLSPSECVNRWSAYLRERKGCDLVIVLSHLGYDGRPGSDDHDCGMAAMSRGVDMVIGGHSHTYLPEATYVNDLDGKPVMIVQDYRWGLYVGDIKVN